MALFLFQGSVTSIYATFDVSQEICDNLLVEVECLPF